MRDLNEDFDEYEKRLAQRDARIAELEMQLAEAKGQIETLDRSNNRLRQKLDRRQ